MQNDSRTQFWLRVFGGAGLLLFSCPLVRSQGAPDASLREPGPDLKSLAATVHELQSQVQSLTSQVNELRTAEQRASLETRELRAELNRPRVQPAHAGDVYEVYPPPASQATPPSGALVLSQGPPATSSSLEQRVSNLEDDQHLMNEKVTEQSQTKVESGSKYRVRLSGIILLNMFTNRGNTDSIDVPQIAEAQDMLLGSPGSFGGTLRQSIIGLDVFGPTIAGARSSADVKFDFAGGFPYHANGVSEGLVRLRTGTIRLDWKNTSVVAGQDSLFFVPVSPTSIASLAVPPLSYAGNLWAWTPQVRVEHRITLAENSTLTLQGGILDSLTGVTPADWDGRYPSWGEQSGHPAFATRAALGQKVFGQNVILGFGGFFGRENWGMNRNLKNVAGTIDLTFPLGRFFGLTGMFYRGQSVSGLGGGIGQSVLWSGDIMDPATVFHGLKSEGGWAQLKFTPRANFEINSGFGQDNPFANDLRRYGPNGSYYGPLLSRNQSPFANFIYRLRSDVMFSVEYRYLKTNILDAGSQKLHHVNAALAYTF
jgi:hypothetical protein